MSARRLLVLAAATLASALPAGVALADDPAPVVTAPPYVVTVPPDYCNVVIVVDGPVGPDGTQGPGSTVFTPCGVDPVIVIDGPADVGPSNAEPAPAARLGYVPAWAMMALGL